MAKVPKGYRSVQLQLSKATISIYAGHRMADVLRDMVLNAPLYEGVRLLQIIETVYGQGKKDGARETIESLDRSVADLKKKIPHKTPGRPRKAAARKRR